MPQAECLPSNSFEEELYKDYWISLEYDEYCDWSPREWDCLGVILAWHPRYSLSDTDEEITRAGFTRVSPDTVPSRERLMRACGIDPKKDEVMDLYLLDHGHIALSTTDFGDTWDSGWVGWVVCPYDRIRKEYNLDPEVPEVMSFGFDLQEFFPTQAPTKKVTKAIRDKVREVMRAEIETYSFYVDGDVFRAHIYDAEGNHIDSIGTYYGSVDPKEVEYALSEARLEIDSLEREPINIIDTRTGEVVGSI